MKNQLDNPLDNEQILYHGAASCPNDSPPSSQDSLFQSSPPLCLSVWVWVCLSHSVSVSISTLSLCMCVCVCLTLYQFFSPSLSLSLFLSVCVGVCVSVTLCHSLCPSHTPLYQSFLYFCPTVQSVGSQDSVSRQTLTM